MLLNLSKSWLLELGWKTKVSIIVEYYHIDLLSHKSALTTKYADTTTVKTCKENVSTGSTKIHTLNIKVKTFLNISPFLSAAVAGSPAPLPSVCDWAWPAAFSSSGPRHTHWGQTRGCPPPWGWCLHPRCRPALSWPWPRPLARPVHWPACPGAEEC